ncbi:MAG: hypothetical protein AB8B56_08760 [Crocinitomicaceae bacterium]
MKTTLLILALTTCTFSFSQGLIDGYFKGKGNIDIALSGFTQTAKSYFAGETEVVLGGPLGSTIFPESEKTFNSLGLFAEYGITDKWDVIINAPFINQVFQDGSIATKYEAVKTKVGGRDFSVIPALQVSFPLSDYETENLNSVGQKATLISPKVVVQHNLPGGLFIQAQTGYNYALDPVASSVGASVKLGGSFGKFYVDAWYNFQHGFGDKDFLTPPAVSFREYTVSFQQFGGVVYYGITDMFGIFANASFIFDGRNAYKMPGFGGGLVVKLHLND